MVSKVSLVYFLLKKIDRFLGSKWIFFLDLRGHLFLRDPKIFSDHVLYGLDGNFLFFEQLLPDHRFSQEGSATWFINVAWADIRIKHPSNWRISLKGLAAKYSITSL